jgi:hypothetical protein
MARFECSAAARLRQAIGDLVMDIDILKEAQRGRPTVRQMRDE